MPTPSVNSINISSRKIGDLYPPLVIAEIGINHGGCLSTAKSMVLEAYKSGCEIIKHQTHFVHDEMTPDAKNIFPPNADCSIWDVMQSSSLSKDEEIVLKQYTEDLGMIYISTPFSRAAADFLAEINIPAFKIGSGECNHLPLIEHICSFQRPIIMSTGMQTIDSIKPSVSILEDYSIPYALLECSNLYPAPPEIVSLSGITELRHHFPNAVVGFSDHSIGPSMSLASVALGASIIERHFTDTRYRNGPDIICSMDSAELSFLITRSKEIHTALYNTKQRTGSEESVYLFARSSIVADRDIPANHVITSNDIWARRPGSGEISVTSYYDIIGKCTNRAIKKNTQLMWSDFHS